MKPGEAQPAPIGGLSEALPQIACVTRTSASYTCHRRAFRPRRKTKNGSDKGVRAGCVGYTTTDNVSTTQLKGHVSYVVDTPNRTTAAVAGSGPAWQGRDAGWQAACRRAEVPRRGRP